MGGHSGVESETPRLNAIQAMKHNCSAVQKDINRQGCKEGNFYNSAAVCVYQPLLAQALH